MERVEIASILNRLVISDRGKKLGEVADLIFDTKSGEILHIVLKNHTPYASKLNLEKTKEGNYLVPFAAVKSIGDFIIVSEEDIV